MFTRFRTSTAYHLFEAPLIKISLDTPGAMLLAALGGAYEFEETHLRIRLMEQARDLRVALGDTSAASRSGVSAFVRSLDPLIEFLQSTTEPAVALYSYERTPSIDDILDAFVAGAGANDWAIEELGRKGTNGRKAMLSALKKERDSGRILSAIALLLIVFQDDQTINAVRQYVETCEDDIQQAAAQLIAAYTLK